MSISIIEIIIARIAQIATIALHIFFLYRTLDTRVNKKVQLIAAMSFAAIRIIYYAIGLQYRPYFSLASGIVYASIVFWGNFKVYTIWTIISVVLDGIVDATVIYLYLLLPGTSVGQVDMPGIHRIFIILFAKSALFFVYFIITKKIDKQHLIGWNVFMLLLSIPVGCWIIIEVLFKYNEALSSPLLAAASTALLLMMASMIILYNYITASTKELAQSKLQLRTAEMTYDHINQINELYTTLSAIRHDLKNHFTAIIGYLRVKDYTALEKYIGNFTDIGIDSYEYVKHPVLNALISARVSVAVSLNIKFVSDFHLPEKLPISDVDLCILLSNILDNAFEANAKVQQSRYITIYTRIIHSYWVVACRNATHRQNNFKATGSLKSSKEEKGVHGIGTKQIEKIAEKAEGFVTYRHENYEFSTLAMLKLSVSEGEYAR